MQILIVLCFPVSVFTFCCTDHTRSSQLAIISDCEAQLVVALSECESLLVVDMIDDADDPCLLRLFTFPSTKDILKAIVQLLPFHKINWNKSLYYILLMPIT